MGNCSLRIFLFGGTFVLFSFLLRSPALVNQSSFSANNCICNVRRDSLTLLDLYNSSNIRWDINEPMSNWLGLTLNEQGCVEEFLMTTSQQRLYGEFPESFFTNLLCLKKIKLRYQDISITLPSGIGNLLELEVIDFFDCAANGIIPPEIGQLSNLRVLNIEANDLEGPIPPEIGNLANLQEINLRWNNLSGRIPPQIGNLSSINIINLNNNDLEGPIPPEIGELTTLRELHIENNNLNGRLPPEMGKLVNLLDLRLSDNELEGVIPFEWGNMRSLQGLWMRNNKLEGTIPESFKDLRNLEWLSLGKNNFSIDILSDATLLEALRSLSLSDNNLEGGIPEGLGYMPKLRYLYLSNNQLSGLIPKGLDNEAIFDIYVNNNNFDTLPVFANAIDIYIEMNRITFDDLIPNIAWTGNWIEYVPQKTFFPDSTIIFNKCELPVINLNIDQGIEDNVYTWYKNGDSLTITNSYKLNLRNIFSEFEDYSGIYNCTVTNPIIQDLILESGFITIELDRAFPIPDTIYVEESVCIGESVEIAGDLHDCSMPNVLKAVPDPITGCPTMYAIKLNCNNCQPASQLEIPGAFSPNGDGINETFFIPGIIEQPGVYSENELLIYDQSGQVVYRKRNYQNEWDGKDNTGKTLPVGTYFYVFKYGVQQAISGMITIVR